MIDSRGWLALALAAFSMVSGCNRRGPAPAPRERPGRPDYGRLTEMRPVPGNMLSNGGFEYGTQPWFTTDGEGWEGAPMLASGVAHSGRASLHAPLEGVAGSRGQHKWGAIYEVGKVPFPKHLSLWYRVDRWQAANAPQYLMLMVAVCNGEYSYQIRYVFGGIERMPYNSDGNVRVVLVRTELPRPGEWTHLTIDLEQDFRAHWQRVPSEFDRLRFAPMVRYDATREPLRAPVSADVYFDDMYVGWFPAPDDREAHQDPRPDHPRPD